jgi:hypothetical protein
MANRDDVKEETEPICVVEFLKGSTSFFAKLQCEHGGVQNYQSESFEEVLEQVTNDLQEESEARNNSREEIKEDTETICFVEFLKGPSSYVGKVQSELGGIRDYRSSSFDEVLRQVVDDLREEFE